MMSRTCDICGDPAMSRQILEDWRSEPLNGINMDLCESHFARVKGFIEWLKKKHTSTEVTSEKIEQMIRDILSEKNHKQAKLNEASKHTFDCNCKEC